MYLSPTDETEPEQEKESTWTPFIEVSKKLLYAKQNIADFLQQADFNNPRHREWVIRAFLNLLNSELQSFITEREYKHLTKLITQLNLLHQNNLPQFKDVSFRMLGEFSVVMQNAGLGLLARSKKDPISKLFESAELEPRLKNSYEVEIHPTMLMLAHVLAQRTLRKYDNVLIVEGEPGNGKTTFSFSLATTLSDVYKTYGIDSPFTTKNIFVGEEKLDVIKILQEAPQYSILDFTEAANQFSARDFMDFAQKGLINLVERIRFHGLTLILEWASIRQLDINIRENRPLYYISVMRKTDKGIALVRATNKNPYSSSYLHIYNRDKAKLPLVTFAERMHLLESDPLCVAKIPFYPLPQHIDDKLQATKNIKFNPYLSKVQRTKEDVLLDCISYIASLASQNKEKFTKEDLDEYKLKRGVEIYWEDLIRYIRKVTLVKKEYLDPEIDLTYAPLKGFFEKYLIR